MKNSGEGKQSVLINGDSKAENEQNGQFFWLNLGRPRCWDANLDVTITQKIDDIEYSYQHLSLHCKAYYQPVQGNFSLIYES